MEASKYKYDFSKYKTDISLPDFLLKFGWEFTIGSSRSAPKMTDGKNVIVIKRNSAGHFTYWDVHNESLRGLTIIDFLKQHILEETGKMPGLKDIGVTLEDYIKNNEVVLPENSLYKITSSNLDEKAIIHLVSQLQPYKSDFLQNRGINIDILQTNTFKDVFYTRTYKKDDYIYRNTCVKMINTTGVQGISQRNDKFKGVLGNHFDSIAASNYDKARPIDKMYIGESMIDCASHYEINHFNTNLNILYISSEGTLTVGQIDLIKLILKKNSVLSITTIFDNDKQGYIFSLQLLSKLKNLPISIDKNKKSPEEIKKILLELTDNRFQIHFSKNKDWNDDIN